MHWSWAEFEDTPIDVIQELLTLFQEEDDKRRADADFAELKRRRGSR